MTAPHIRPYIRALAALFVVAAACSDSTASKQPPATLAGTWTATKVEYVQASNTSNKVDIVPLGGSATLVLNADSTFQFTITQPGEGPFVVTGHWSATGEEMTLNYNMPGFTGTWQFDLALNENSLSLNGAHTDYDVNNDGTNEDARLNLAMTRG